MLKVGVNTGNECGNSEEGMIANIKNAGFECVMLAHRKNNEELIGLINSLGMAAEYYHIGGACTNSLWAKGDVGHRRVNEIIDQVRFCGKHKVKIAVLHVVDGSLCDLAFAPNQIGVERLNKILEVANEVGVKIAIENLGPNSIKYLNYLFKRIDDPTLGFCYDVGHHNLYTKKLNLLKKYGKRLIAVHLHDNLCDYEFGFDYSRDLHYLPFDGKIDFKEVCHSLNKLNYAGVIMLEIHKSPLGGPHLYKERDNLEFLKQAKIRAEKLASMIEGKED